MSSVVRVIVMNRAVPILSVSVVSAFFSGIGIGKIKSHFTDTADTFLI
jgi:hypothetical protein